MLAHRAVVWFTGENYLPATGFTIQQQDRMVEYLNSGGRLIAMGQDLASVIGEATPDDCAQFFYCYRLGANYVQDSISGNACRTNPVMAAHTAPAALQQLAVDLSAPRVLVDSWSPVRRQRGAPGGQCGRRQLQHRLQRGHGHDQPTV